MKNTACASCACAAMTARPSPWMNVTRSRTVAIARMRRASVSGYQRERNPLPFSPCLSRPEPVQDATVTHAILQDCLKCAFTYRARWACKCRHNRIKRHLECKDFGSQPFSATITENGLPDCRDILIDLDHCHMFGEPLKCHCKADNAPACKRLYKLLHMRRRQAELFAHTRGQPTADSWHKPRLATRVTERTPLWNGGDIDHAREVVILEERLLIHSLPTQHILKRWRIWRCGIISIQLFVEARLHVLDEVLHVSWIRCSNFI